jgi:hypothetical protein
MQCGKTFITLDTMAKTVPIEASENYRLQSIAVLYKNVVPDNLYPIWYSFVADVLPTGEYPG